ncbi:hypothetical protein K435DRAFT_877470 [Dendrothele bispora CBS 962.96]|uniref:Uncharacterized protein n=1 Tax=Dendrothele bispora (strain CBS 962.96) TaxID=1314807 RepID=A0A4S8KPW9_DENBC|nr:hypothetical protein K435DRAFT_877470 [Dendrothele bispora CBS 962.96]
MSLTIPVEDLDRLQVSSHMSSDGTPAIDLSFRPPVSDDLVYPSTKVKHCGITVTFRRSVNTDGSGWSLAVSTNIPTSCSPFVSGGNIGNHLDVHEIASHKSPSSLMSAPNEIEVENTQHHSTTSVHSFNLTENAMTDPEPADNMNQDWFLQFMGYDFRAPTQISTHTNDLDTNLYNAASLPIDYNQDNAQDMDQVVMDESDNSNCRGPSSCVPTSTGSEFPQNQQHSTSQSEFNSATDEFHDSVSDFDDGRVCDTTNILFMGMSI